MTANNDYILARWRDAITDPPDDGWSGQYRYNDGETVSMGHGFHHGGSWWTELEIQESRTPEPGDQWLDITAIPGVAREAVQAAVDEIASHKFQLVWWQSPEDILSFHTGVTPSEVSP